MGTINISIVCAEISIFRSVERGPIGASKKQIINKSTERFLSRAKLFLISRETPTAARDAILLIRMKVSEHEHVMTKNNRGDLNKSWLISNECYVTIKSHAV